MKKLLVGTGAVALMFGLLGVAGTPAAVKAETSNPQPGFDGVIVRLCTEGADIDNLYCSSQNEILASQTATTRTYTSSGGTVALPGTYQFTNAQLSSGGGSPRAVVFGPISGTYSGFGSAWIWGYLFKNATIGQPADGIPTELFSYALGAAGAGLANSRSGSVGREFAFTPLAQFNFAPYYVSVYLDQALPGGLANPGIGTPNTLDGQVWGWQIMP